MPVQVVLTHGRNYSLRRLRRAWIAVLGVVLVGVAFVASLISLPLIFGLSLIFVLSTQSHGSGPSELPDIPWGPLWGLAGQSFLIMVVTGIPGTSILRGKRRLVLFLRRFGYDEATKAISIAAASSLGTRWRLVTLDDREIEPLGLTAPTRLLYQVAGLGWTGLRRAVGIPYAVITKLLPISFVAVFAIPAIDYFTRPGRPKLSTVFEYFRLLADLVEVQRLPPLRLDLHLAFLIAVLLTVTAIGGFVLLFLAFAVAIPLLVPLTMVSTTVEGMGRAERDKRVTIGGPSDIEPAVRLIAFKSTNMLAPRLVVVKVSSEMWRSTVARFGDVSAAALIDVSDPTESLLWEIEHLTSIGARTVLVGEYDRVRWLAEPRSSTPMSIQDRLSALIDGKQVLAYKQGRSGMRRFARELADAFETAAG